MGQETQAPRPNHPPAVPSHTKTNRPTGKPVKVPFPTRPVPGK